MIDALSPPERERLSASPAECKTSLLETWRAIRERRQREEWPGERRAYDTGSARDQPADAVPPSVSRKRV